MVTGPPVALILQQTKTYFTETKDAQRQNKLDASKTQQQQQEFDASELLERLPSSMQRALKVFIEKGVSSWLSTLPIAERGFAL